MSEQPPNEDVLRKVQGLLDLAAKAGTPEEAAAAAAKATELMERYNLDTAMLERRQGKDGKREQAEVTGGHYKWQRELWAWVAQVNFCLHWTQDYYAKRERAEYSTLRGTVYPKGSLVLRKRHMLVGRKHNVAATRAMAGYLEQAINRLLKERLTDSTGKLNSADYNGGFGAAFREGAADNFMVRLSRKRDQRLAADRRQAEAAAAAPSSGTALSLQVFIDEETDANLDYIHGAGYSAKRAEQQAKEAVQRREREQEYTRWAKANPEEAKAKADKARAKVRASGGRSSERPKDWGAYYAGSDASKKVSLEPQVDQPTRAERITGPKAIHVGARK